MKAGTVFLIRKEILNKPNLFTYLCKRDFIDRNRNLMFVMVGETGTSKSLSALALAYAFDKKFTADRVVFETKDFYKIVENEKLKKGSALVFDEAGVDTNARHWWKDSNMILSYITQTFRYRNLVTIFTVPALDYVDSQVRKLIHFLIETKSIIYSKNLASLMVFRLDVNTSTGKIYNRLPRIFIIGGDGKVGKLTKILIHRPPRWLEDTYNERKNDYNKRLMGALKLRSELSGVTNTSRGKIPMETNVGIWRDLQLGRPAIETAKKWGVSPAHISLVRKGYYGDMSQVKDETLTSASSKII